MVSRCLSRFTNSTLCRLHCAPSCLLTNDRLAPGEEWCGEFVVRHHAKFWRKPIFDDSLPPMDAIPMSPVPGQRQDNIVAEDVYLPEDPEDGSVYPMPEI